ncbi:hypothetical protein ACFQMA_23010 [Halosimplex aquaticum]|uniref:Uncharacterized protein n=1 Tax=Halosimplex aquaticum TaxID=3026162 RepID=A0ABD5YAG9_9EURY|nr:hypothetical protein [Halosimplex aquaticum]
MRQAIERANQESSGARAYVLALYYFVTGNISLVIILMGVASIGLGATLVNGTPAIVIGGEDGFISLMNGLPDGVRSFGAVEGTVLAHKVFAGMMGIFGATLIALGASIYGFLFANKLYARATSSA